MAIQQHILPVGPEGDQIQMGDSCSQYRTAGSYRCDPASSTASPRYSQRTGTSATFSLHRIPLNCTPLCITKQKISTKRTEGPYCRDPPYLYHIFGLCPRSQHVSAKTQRATARCCSNRTRYRTPYRALSLHTRYSCRPRNHVQGHRCSCLRNCHHTWSRYGPYSLSGCRRAL